MRTKPRNLAQCSERAFSLLWEGKKNCGILVAIAIGSYFVIMREAAVKTAHLG